MSETRTSLGLAVLRVVVGVIFLTHGIPKLFGGMEGTAGFLAELGIPASTAAAWLLALLEVGGGILLIVGLLVAPVAALFVVEMLMGIVLVHASTGWYVVGPGQGGSEFNVLLIAANVALILAGPGAWALDRRRSGTARTAPRMRSEEV